MHTKNVKRLLANEGICLITHPEIALTLGKSEAIFLQQLHYWLTTDSEMGTILDGQRWIYNSYKSWTENLRIYSESTIRRAISKLEKLGIILSKNLNKKRSDHTKWYTIDYGVLKNLIPSLSTKKQSSGAGNSDQEKSLLKMNSPSAQNEQIITKENRNNFKKKSYSHTQTPQHLQNDPLEDKQTTIEKDIFQQMVSIWNQIVEEGKKTIELNPKRYSFLKAAFTTKFQSCLEKWKEFCQRIASSKFLMGEIKASFKASLDWVLKFDILQRILEGDYGVGDRTVYLKEDKVSCQQQMTAEIETSPESQDIKQFRLALLNKLGRDVYTAWFKETSVHFSQKKITFKAQSRFVKDWIDTHFRTIIEELCRHEFPNCLVVVE